MITRLFSSNNRLCIHNAIILSTGILTQLSRLPAEIEILAHWCGYHHDEIKTKALGEECCVVIHHPAREGGGIKLQSIRGQVRVLSWIRIPTFGTFGKS
jgi:hypothetical protein